MRAPPSRFVSRLALLAGTVLTPAAFPAWADAVTDWNQTTEAVSVAAGAPPQRNRVNAMVQIAVHDALNSIHARYKSYADIPAAASGASADAAVAAASFRVLSQTVPSQAAALMATYENRLDALPDCLPAFPTCLEDGIRVGKAAADAVLALRVGDGSATPHRPYNLAPGPGVYQLTPPAFAAPLFAGWALLKPFGLRSGDQFRAEGSRMLDITSKAYARDFNEVKRVGSMTSEAEGNRTPDQSAIARYWPVGAGGFNAVTRVIVAGRGLDLWEHARLFALVNMALSDSAVVAFDTKYTYNFWRPVTAIRAADTDGNPDTIADPAWLSYQVTPSYPDYTCGLTNNSGAALEVLRQYFETDAIAYTFTAAGVTRSYSSLSQAGDESVDARVFGGMHFRTGCERGLRQGEHVARFVVKHHLEPVKHRMQEQQEQEGR
jgi:hypothetical protein